MSTAYPNAAQVRQWRAVFPMMIRTLRRATRSFPKPMGTAMVADRRTLFELLVSTVCSAQSRDAVTYPVMQRLFAVANTPEAIARMPEIELAKRLYPISYYRTKAKHLRALSSAIIRWRQERRDRLERGGAQRYYRKRPFSIIPDIPDTMDELLTLPGVGRKTANLVLGEGMGKREGICVDTHVHRISNRLGIVRTKTREVTERALMAVLPKKYWITWNPLLVMWGQNVCTPISPKCSVCPIRQWCERRGVSTSR